MTIAGQCRCGAVRYALAIEALPPVYACHCHVCQRATGSAFSVQALVGEDGLTVSGPIVTREFAMRNADGSDSISVHRFCGECRARIYNTNSARPGLAVLRAGTLDRSEELECRAHIYTNYRQRWVRLDPETPQWGEGPDVAAFMAVMQVE